ncbi:deazaflavin-dependent oxidoreductase, nitroreductase family [Amycolatopsis tolypomycina]|uniref:Deazaflavin-dependent oxidoreductase, nitroreductase family n=1 Tax=Amycolatopsis tolypomycina TaxID=208445 RepID=A0A1H4YBK3_9PSEU|nr:nitroreductase family deazaflavin-dependent oxidoreductase [Amycolatopsis tolypomycina]SED14468.1 deazaflavin-dependent oxidoreductase, nitroreductase family [Amycolatopsis tolypomycina]
MTTAQSYRRLVNTGNKIVVGLQRLGVAFGPMQLLTVPGRRTGVPRTFPIAVNPIDGHHYVVQAYPKAAWVANVRAAGEVTLTRGRRSSAARLVELPVEERGPVLRRLVETSPASVGKRFVTTGLAAAPTPDAVAAAAGHIAVFRVEQG